MNLLKKLTCKHDYKRTVTRSRSLSDVWVYGYCPKCGKRKKFDSVVWEMQIKEKEFREAYLREQQG